jgi:hypothetical protein
MKSLSTCIALAMLCPLVPAQTPTLLHGQKVLIDAKGNAIPFPAPATTVAPAPLVGGADACTTPDVITGLGGFNFDNTLATTGAQGQTESLCLAYNTTGLTNDVWFTWTAPYTGALQIETCNGATVDTKIAAYPGNTCPAAGSALACNDDFCGLQSHILIPVTSGNAYVIQVGNFPGANGTVGTFTLVQPPPPPANDTCTAPMTVVGTGSFPYDNTSATTGPEGQAEAACNVGGVTTVAADIWFTWVATFSGTARVATCNGTTANTKIAAYAGAGCPTAGSALACNDDVCGTQSQIDFTVTQGSSYTLQIGDNTGGLPGPGSFTIGQYVPIPLDDCQLPGTLPGPGTYAYNTTTATNSAQTATCGNIYFDYWYSYPATTSGTATLTTCGLITGTYFDTKCAIYNGTGCPTSASIACVDDAACATQSGLTTTLTWPTVCGQMYTIRMGSFGQSGVTGSFSVTESGTQCGPTGVPYCFGDGTGTACPCGNNGTAGNGCASSVNANGANLSTSGAANLANDTLVLQGTGMPNSSCLYFQGTTQISNVFGDGLRCAGGSVIRLGTKTNVGGSSQYPTAGNPSVSVKGAVTAPGTRTYQTWYRNAAAFCTPSTFNLTNGVLITWQ